MADKPLIETKVLTEFGEVYDSPDFYQVNGADKDHTYVPGFSDLRRARAVAQARAKRGEIPASAVPLMQVRLQWVRTQKTNSAPDNTKEVQAGNDGYREVTNKDIGQPWLTALPQGAKVIAGGRIQKGDVTLMVCDGQQAAKNAARNAFQTKRMLTESKSPLLKEGDRVRGADPYIESKLAEKPIGAS